MKQEPQADAALLRAALSDKEAFACFYRQHSTVVYRWFAYRVRRDGTVASELTAEAFAEALRSLPRFKGAAPGSGTAWLFGIARNLFREYHRTNRVRDDARRQLQLPREALADTSLEDAENRADAGRLRVAVETALQELPAAQREAVMLRVVDQLDYPSIASMTASTQETVRLRVSRGLRSLRTQLAPVLAKEQS
jgi:RNA polymerase sigma factor (sigma-70 family)